MRLEKIKLSGFKSFVDPTTVVFPGNLVGIVGPNGCGKSNVIDAVRWVMGESSAKMLRGESMADVIFNGSTSRKPVGAATIELIFDNSDGAAGGQYAQYSQVSIKRQVSRDGQSSYFLNGVRCRRRDVQDLFLGTGLGPRSYSIIEQGMISRLIEARPEELRLFLEEAAGISKYKERRRETENRIRHTRENLERLEDLRDEVQKQLRHLERQAATAEKYKQYKEGERRLKAELLALRWRALDEELKAHEGRIQEKETAVEEATSAQRRVEATIEGERERHVEVNDRFNEVQGRFYAVGADIARLEQAIHFARDTRAQQRQDLEQLESAWDEAEHHRADDEARHAELEAHLAEEEPHHRALAQEAESAAEELAEAEQAMHDWQIEWEQFNQRAAEPAQTAQVERTRINHLESQDRELQRRSERHAEELSQLDGRGLQEEIDELEAGQSERTEQSEGLQERLVEINQAIVRHRQSIASHRRLLDGVRQRLQVVTGRHASLEALQQAALGKEEGAALQWLGEQGLGQARRLAEDLLVEPGWERAVETVLGHHLQAVCVVDLDGLVPRLGGAEALTLSLFETAVSNPAIDLPDSLAAKVGAPQGVEWLLGSVGAVEDLPQALDRREALSAHESLITRQGVWVGRNWMRLPGEPDETSGVLERAEEIRLLDEERAGLEEQSEALTRELEDHQESLHGAEVERDRTQAELDEVNRWLSELSSALSARRTRAEHLKMRRERVSGEIRELDERIAQGRAEIDEARERLHVALEAVEGLSANRDSLIERRESLRRVLDEARQGASHRRSQAHEVALRIESMRASEKSLCESLERVQGQLRHMRQRREELAQLLEQGEGPLQEQQTELEVLLGRRVEVERELGQAREALEIIDQGVRELERERHEAERNVGELRTELERLRMGRQEVAVREQTIDEQLGETGLGRAQLFDQLPEDATIAQWQEQVERIGQRIQRLGPINLAAIEEFQEQSERMHYLDAQHQDIITSLETLETAIRKIDRETRTRFKETFDQVNTGLQTLFPRLFGGGHAYLQLTGEDLLDTGVAVMARPPGKRNSSIHLLSGGEKALTAVALVFAIFDLNPAPFCLLDEVDAPLDDANVGRFCEMVRTMSTRVQFIFITHNKVTMEMADQLTGVTMQEPGVSRLVSVDVEEAAQLAAV
jgi:chromosome segregation protein